ncbi:MAG: DNA repair protein RecO [Firmicutes bacterium]|nr:DNA repair protein RecO [Bacillota bacterium]MDD4263669.1 DNA repair protein RecO [Bacillota bacterium]MDD4693971.1 DNA repair protein RecO [Bacillota bacterium]
MFWCQGIVIKTKPMKEADRIVVLYTKERGKLGTVAKGSRRPNNRLASLVQPFTKGRFLLSDPTSGLKDISQGIIIESNQDLREDLLKLAATNYFLELVDSSVETEDPDLEVYQSLLLGLKLIKLATDLELSLRYLEYRLLSVLGWNLQMQNCTSCGKDLMKEDDLKFSPVQGGLTCVECRFGDEISLSVKTRAVLLSFDRLQPKALIKLKLDKKDKDELEKILRNAWDARIEKKPKTYLFWKEVSSLENSNSGKDLQA